MPVSATFVSTDDGWALGTAPCSHKPCTSIVRTRNGGRTWHKQRVRGQVSHIETGGGYVFVATDTCVRPNQHCRSQVLASPVGHDAWRALTPMVNTDVGVSALTVSDSDWFAASARGVLHGNGMSYESRLPSPCPVADADYSSPRIAVADAQDLDAACVSGGAAGSAQYELFGSTDGGRVWRKSRTFRAPSYLAGIADNTRGVLIMASSSGGSSILRTADDGRTIRNDHVRTPTGGIPWTDVGFTTPSQALAVLADSGLYLSHDAGKTFSRVRF